MKYKKLPLVTAGGDWAGVMNVHSAQFSGGVAQHGVEETRRRLRLASIMFVLVFAVLGGRLAQLTLAEDPALARAGLGNREAQVQRPAIVDRNGVVLASQIYLTTLGANASEIDNADMVVAQLSKILPDLNTTRARRLLAGDRHYVELIKGLTPAQKRTVLDLGNPGLKLRREAQRVYPSGSVASHVVGFSSTDMRGLMGLERRLDEQVQMSPVFETSLDIRVQHAVRESLSAAIAKFSAKGGGAIVMDVTNGEILALVSLPDFDINTPSATPLSRHFNAMTMGVYELGSIFKVMTAAMALESGEVRVDETFDTAAPLKIGRATINDVHGEKRPLTPREIVVHSSNIGSVQLALRVSDVSHYDFMEKLGLTRRLRFELPETGAPLMPVRWTDIERATTSFGHGFSVTPLHALIAGAAMVNGGVLYPPRLTRTQMPVGTRVISERTSAMLRDMMRDVVTVGTGKKANVSGYGVIGKTGSANKPARGSYDDDALITSFLGAFPYSDPRYALLVVIDEPQGIAETHNLTLAGWNAAPTAAEIVRRAAPLLGVRPAPQRLVPAREKLAAGTASPTLALNAELKAEVPHAP
ncbi:MAG: penicillin-binding protein 2 [PS1 clade bacterium]|nr:penicillin-binding protein 2 [PS1 clade bacterium]